MKKFIKLIVMSFGIILFAGSASATIVNSPLTEIWVKFGLTFHRPKLDCKEGFGFCLDVTWGIDGGGYSGDRVCPVKGHISDKNQLIIQVNESDLAAYEGGSTLPQFKGKDNITLLDPYTLSKELAQKLGVQSPVIIKPGVYPVTYSDKVYTVTIQL